MIGRYFDQSDDRASYQRRRLYPQSGVGHSLADPGTQRIVRSGLFRAMVRMAAEDIDVTERTARSRRSERGIDEGHKPDDKNTAA